MHRETVKVFYIHSYPIVRTVRINILYSVECGILFVKHQRFKPSSQLNTLIKPVHLVLYQNSYTGYFSSQHEALPMLSGRMKKGLANLQKNNRHYVVVGK